MSEAVSGTAAPVRTFERKATGLVRAAGTLDVLVYNINFVSIGLMAVLVFLFSTAFYPGANLYVTALLTLAAVIPTSLVFAFFAAAMPRSGGDYVYVSRTLHPALGMMSSWNNTAWWFMYGGVPSAFFAYYGVGPFFSVVGERTDTSWMVDFGNWCVKPLGAFIVGSALIVALVAVFILGLHVFFRLQNVLFVLGLLSVLMIIFIWLFQSTGSFEDHVASHTGQAFGPSLDKAASKAGYVEGGPFSLKWTLLAGTWIYINLVFNQSSAYIGGEVRRASRLQLWSMPAAALVAIGFLLILLGLGDKVAGLDTFGKLAAATGLPFSALAAQGIGSTAVAALILFGFIFFSYTWLPGQILNASRNFLAYSLDGLMPRKLGTVHPRYHTPVYALLLVGAGSIGALWLFTHWDTFAALVGIFGFILGFAIVSAAAIAFPYRLPELFESSPVRWRIGGIPVMSLLGAGSLVALGIMAWAFWTDPSAGLQGHLTNKILNFAIFASGLVIYFAAKLVQRTRGVDVSQRFKEIPIE
ncbi:MAG TPA: APC family permease [Thermoleophilaceae bacterium]|nr:APC family permease [Thermoleophilaceae bacterium]